MTSPDDVQLTDLQVIQRYSIAVRGAAASRDEVIATLTADLEWLRGGRRRAPAPAVAAKAPGRAAPPPAQAPARAAAKAPAKPPAKAPARAAAKAPAKPPAKAPARVAAKAPAKKGSKATKSSARKA